MFSQLLDFLDRNAFNYLARKYDGDRYVKQFSCWNQLAVMMFGWVISPEAANQAFHMTYSHKDKGSVLGHSNFYLTPPSRQTLRHKLALPNNYHITSWEYDDYLFGKQSCSSLDFRVTYADTQYKIGKLVLYGTLLKYIQDKGWLHEYDITY